MGAFLLLLTLAMTPAVPPEKPKCERAIRATVWPEQWREAKDCEKVEMCTCGPLRCGWKAVSVPMWVLTKSPKPDACSTAPERIQTADELATGQ
jgi:hypothetical protein